MRMILFAPQKKSVLKGITMALLVFFVMSSLAGATESVLCIDQGERHILGEEYFPLDACHALSATHSENKSYQTALAGSGEHHENSCVDVALRSQEPSILRHKLEKVTPIALSSVLVSSYPPWFSSSSYLNTTVTPFYKYPRILPFTSLRSVILLI